MSAGPRIVPDEPELLLAALGAAITVACTVVGILYVIVKDGRGGKD